MKMSDFAEFSILKIRIIDLCISLGVVIVWLTATENGDHRRPVGPPSSQKDYSLF